MSAASRAAEESFSDGGMICTYQLGASARSRRERLPCCSLCCRLSSTSSTGRYASLPARRSEQRPRPTRTASPRSHQPDGTHRATSSCPCPASTGQDHDAGLGRAGHARTHDSARPSRGRAPRPLDCCSCRDGTPSSPRAPWQWTNRARGSGGRAPRRRAWPQPRILEEGFENELIERARQLQGSGATAARVSDISACSVPSCDAAVKG